MIAPHATVIAIRAAQDRGATTAAALVRRYLARIAKYDPHLGSFSDIFADRALERAAQLDAARVRGERMGSLHGVPLAHKDLTDIAGFATRAGSHALVRPVSVKSAVVVQRLEAAGAISLGRTRMVELAYGGWGTNAIDGTPWNPWHLDRHRVAGGSSSGAAVAVAAGLIPAAIGTDTGGSVRIPAAICGVVGFKPTAGLVPLAPSLDTVGPLTRTVADARLLYDVMAGTQTQVAAAPSLRGVTLGVLEGADLQPAEPVVRDTYARTLARCEAAGARLRVVSLGQSFDHLVTENGRLMSHEAWKLHGALVEASGASMDPAVVARIRAGQSVSAADYAALLVSREREQRRFGERHAGIDCLLTPATALRAVPVDEVDETRMPYNLYTRFVNYLGLCAVAVPAAVADGLPIGMQFVGQANAEPTVLAVAEAYESLRGPFPAPALSRQ